MLLDRSGRLWCGTGRGLNCYNAASDTFHVPEAGNDSMRVLANSIIRALHEDDSGNLFVGTQSGLYRYDPRQKNLYRYQLPNGEYGDRNIIVNICPGADGRLWICTYDGLLLLDPATGKIREYPLGDRFQHDPQNNMILSVVRDADEDSIVWVGTETGLHRLNWKTNQFVTYRTETHTPFSNNVIKCMLPTENGLLLLGTDRGLNVFDTKTGGVNSSYLHDTSDAWSLADNRIDQLYQDSNGIRWLATRNGISRISPFGDCIDIFDLKKELSWTNESGAPVCMAWTPAGVCWLAVDGEIMALSEKDGSIRRYHSDYPIMGIQTFFVDSRGIVWAGSKNGLWYHDAATDRFHPATARSGGPESRFINAIVEDESGDLWVTGTGCIHRIHVTEAKSRNALKLESKRIPLPNTSEGVSTLYSDRNGRIWAGVGSDRICRYDPDSGRSEWYDPSQGCGLASLRVKCFFEDRHGVLHVATDSGIYRYDPAADRFLNRLPVDGFDCSYIQACRMDAANNIWILYETGLARLSPEEELHLWNFETFLSKSRFLKEALRIDDDGSLRAGYSSGWLRIDPEHLPAANETSRLQITGVELLSSDSQWVDLPSAQMRDIRLRYNQNSIRISFSNMGNLFGNNLYSYRLKGVDDAWHTGSRNSVSYINLAPGNYLFQVRNAALPAGPRNEAVSMQIVVTPAWWATRVAWCLYFLIVGAIVWSVWRFVHLRIRKLQDEQARQREYYLQYMAAHTRTVASEKRLEEMPEPRTDQDSFLDQVVKLITEEIRNENLDIQLLCDRLHVTHKSFYEKM